MKPKKLFIRRDLKVDGQFYFRPPIIPKKWLEKLNWVNARQLMFEFELDTKNERIILRRSK